MLFKAVHDLIECDEVGGGRVGGEGLGEEAVGEEVVGEEGVGEGGVGEGVDLFDWCRVASMVDG